MSLALQMKDYRLTTARIYYHLPDHPRVLQTYVWQEYDQAPKFPELNRFLTFWRNTLEGRLHSVEVATVPLIQPSKWRHVQTSYLLN